MTQGAELPDMLETLSNQMADAVERVGAALVQVNGRVRQPATGTVFGPDLVLAADHAVERDEDLSVQTHDGRRLAAGLAGRDAPTDLAVLRVPGLTLGAATPAVQAPKVGHFALAVGRPGGGALMASVGIVSAVGGPLRTPRGGVLERYIRTDATPYPGFSGGPLIDARGAVLGILTTGLVTGVALAIPALAAWSVGETLARLGYVRRGYLGLGSQPVRIPTGPDGRGREHGLLVVEVAPDSPAARAGVLIGDVLVILDGSPLRDVEDLQALLVGDRVGATLALQVIRGGARTTLRVTIGQRPPLAS